MRFRFAKGEPGNCQLTCISEIGKNNSWINNFLQMWIKILRKAKKNTIFIKRMFMRILRSKNQIVNLVDYEQINVCPGDWVKVRSKKEIRRMLDDQKKYKGCRFMNEMSKHCGKAYKVLKAVDYFFDEARQKMCKCRDTVILDGVVCSGRQRLYKVSCDRNCFFFWHLAWLEKVE